MAGRAMAARVSDGLHAELIKPVGMALANRRQPFELWEVHLPGHRWPGPWLKPTAVPSSLLQGVDELQTDSMNL